MRQARKRRTEPDDGARGRRPSDRPRPWRRASLWLAALALLGPSPVGAQQDPAAAPDETPRVRLDQLLELPAGRTYQVEKRGGMTRQEWTGRFQELIDGLRETKESLDKAETELEQVAGEAEPWTLGPALPGVTGAEAPLDYRLRQEIRRHRSEIERLEDRLTELEVQADLAGVPESWRGRRPASDDGPSDLEELR